MNTSTKPKQPKRPMTRRKFLKILGISGAGLVVVVGGAGAIALPRVREGFAQLPPLTDDPNAWFRITPDGQVMLTLSKIEMGQGIGTAAAQILADELDVPFEQVVLAPASTTTMPNDLTGTAGSTSIMQLYDAFRQGGATARQALIKLAAERSGRPADQFVARAGQVVHREEPNTSFSYGELLQGKQIVRAADSSAPLKARADYAAIGQAIPRRDIPDKLTGQPIYANDVQLDGMLYGRVARPPVFGATIGSVNLEPARALPGVVAVVHEDDFVGVAAETMGQAAAALAAIEITWRQPERPLQQADLEAMLTAERKPTVLKAAGDAEAALRGAQPISRQYRTGFTTHAQMEPMVGVADVRADAATVWAPAQAPLLVRRNVANAVGLKAEQVTVNATMIGGGFGRKALAEAAIEAARLSKAAKRPVKVLWNRGEEFQHGFVQPMTVADFAATLDGQGQIAAWDQHLATGYVLFAFFPAVLRLLAGSDGGATRAAVGPYAMPNVRVAATVKELPVRTGSWRGLGLLPNTFANEQFIDELAAEAKADPVEFRLRHLADDSLGQRLRRVIETAAQQAGWGTPLPAGHGRGIACCTDAETVVAEVAEVRVDRASGEVQVLKVTAAVDCGLVINPNAATAQVEGAIMMGLSAALKEEVTLKDGQWSASNFAAYPIFTIADAPEIAVTLVDPGDMSPGGLGEPPIGPIGAAVANAIAAATGARVRTMPMTPPRVLEALGQQIGKTQA